jgi:hypothetical protein
VVDQAVDGRWNFFVLANVGIAVGIAVVFGGDATAAVASTNPLVNGKLGREREEKGFAVAEVTAVPTLFPSGRPCERDKMSQKPPEPNKSERTMWAQQTGQFMA